MTPNSFKLIDYKCWGAYSVAKILNRVEKGDYDRRQVELQLNDYRIKAERLGFQVSRMFVQATVRDGGTWKARKDGIGEKLVLVPVAKLENREVAEYFELKAEALLGALEVEELPALCPYDERWGNRRCMGFCPVVEWCPEGRAMNKMSEAGEIEV